MNPREGSVGVGMATLEVTLELPRDRLATGLGQIAAVAGALQRLDVLSDLPVLTGQLVDGLLPRPSLLLQVGDRDRHVEHVLEPAEQGQRRLGAGRLRDVM